MPCPAHDIHVGQPQPIGRITHGIHAAFVEVQRREVSGGCHLEREAVLGAGFVNHFAHLGNHRIQPRRFQMAEVQGHAHFARNDVA
eukprot:gene17656-biopygen9357